MWPTQTLQSPLQPDNNPCEMFQEKKKRYNLCLIFFLGDEIYGFIGYDL